MYAVIGHGSMASRFDIYSQLVISTIRIVDINNSPLLLISLFRIVDINISKQDESYLVISPIVIVDITNSNC